MNKEIKPLPAAETGNGNYEGQGQVDTNTQLADGQGFRVWPLLRAGRENAIKAPRLAEMLGCSTRALRAILDDERQRGAIICGDWRGLYRPAPGEQGREEMGTFVAQRTARAISALRSTQSARAALGIPLGQIDFSELLAQEAQRDE